MDNEQLKREINDLKNQVKTLEANYAKHQHDGIDGTNTLRKNIKLDNDQYLQVGYGGLGSNLSAKGQYQYGLSVGKDDGRSGFVNKADVAQVDILYVPGTPFASQIGRFGKIVTALQSSSLSVSSSGDTVTIAGFNFETNELAGSLINIYDSSGALVSVKTIDSNTATVITIIGTWGVTESGCSFDIYRPMYSGSSQVIWQRYYTQEGVDGGVRFGVGATGGGQNGLLYMDSAGDLYWRNKAGSASAIGGGVALGDDSVVTISGGSITPTGQYQQVATEGGASSDELDTIDGTGFSDGTILVIRADSSTQTVVAKDETGNLRLAGDFTMDHTEDTLTLIWNGTLWHEISRSDNDS